MKGQVQMAAPDSSKRYFLTYEGGRIGPLTAEDIEIHFNAGSFGNEAIVWDDDEQQSVREFVEQRRRSDSRVGASSSMNQDSSSLDDEMEIKFVDDEPEEEPKSTTKPEGTAVAPLSTPDESFSSNAPAPERDRIVLIGRRAAGKTVYLATLYNKLWRGNRHLSMKALSGQVHGAIMHIVSTLHSEQWPPATISSTQVELEVHHDGRRHVMISLDYAGELFRKAFVEEQTDSREVRELLNHIDRAAAVIILTDPAVMVSNDVDAIVDDDFGIVQAVQRVRQWPGGEGVPVVLVLTKYDQNKQLLDRYGSRKEFVARHFPALHRCLGKIPIFAVSAVQAIRNAQGRIVPSKDSVPINTEDPLVYCLNALAEVERQEEAETQRQAEQAQLARAAMAMERDSKRRQLVFAGAVATMIFLAACIIALIIVFK